MCECFDAIVIGAGISGIGAARHLRTSCPNLSCVVLERRDTFGGTWDLFKYPGIRSDSDMFTYGYEFRPWPSAKPIAAAADIKAYLHGAIEDEGLSEIIRYGHHITRAEWSSSAGRWRLQCDNGASFECWFLFSCVGYYNQDQGWDPKFEGAERFEQAGGLIVHPQFWTDDIEYAGKRVAVIGSGATAVTLVPNLASKAAHVTMLQRSPTYIVPLPNVDKIAASEIEAGVSPEEVHRRARQRMVLPENSFAGKLAGMTPQQKNEAVIGWMRKALPAEHMPDEEFTKHFTPNYNVWEQRLCVCPDGDFFQAIRRKAASIKTDHVDTFDERGILLKSGDRIDADLIVTATGLQLDANFPMATMQVSVDGVPYVGREHVCYKDCMLSDVPNFAYCRGYFAASWTLKIESVSKYVCRLLSHMQESETSVVVPRVPPEGVGEVPWSSMTSSYFLRTQHLMPKHGRAAPWSPLTSWAEDRQTLEKEPLADGLLEFAALDTDAVPELLQAPAVGVSAKQRGGAHSSRREARAPVEVGGA